MFYIVTGEPFKQSAEKTGEPIKMKGEMEHCSHFLSYCHLCVEPNAPHTGQIQGTRLTAHSALGGGSRV